MADFVLPPVVTDSSGQERRAGYEIEYAGVDLEFSARMVNRLAGGQLLRENPFHYVIKGTDYGDFSVEVDASLLHEQAYEKYLKRVGINIDELDLRVPLESLLARIASVAVPHEIITPPLPFSDMTLIDRIRAELFKAKARGTSESILYGFGVHINPSLPGYGADSLLAYLRAFCLLYDWICKKSKVDWSRRIGPYINRYPDDYVALIMRADYRPDRAQLAEDYVTHIPSRNHALDMLPALVYLEGNRLLASLKEPELIKPRPAFHYRLPNCLIGDPDWRVAHEWRNWVRIERLAHDSTLLNKLTEAYSRYQNSWFDPLLHSWPDRIDAHAAAL